MTALRRWLRVLGVCWPLVMVLPVSAADDLEYGHFQQSRQLALLPQPLISSGRYLLMRGQGLLWVVETPLHSEMRIRDGVLQERHDAAGTWSEPVMGQNESAVLGRLMLALLQQDAQALAEFFRLSELADGAGMRLVPLHPVVAERIPEIIVRGIPQPQELSWVDADGATTRISLSPSPASPPASWVASLQRSADEAAD